MQWTVRFLVGLLLMIWVDTANGQGKILIRDVHIVDVSRGTLKKADAVLVEGPQILAIGKGRKLQRSPGITQTIDGKGAFLIPGLWDMHVHLEGLDLVPDNQALLPVFLAYGITTVRDCASNLGEQVLQWRTEIAKGRIKGPTIFTAGRKLEGKNSIWERDLEISNLQELKDSLDWLDQQQVDFVKITENTLPGPLFLESVKAARARGYRVSGHVPYDLTIMQLADAGFTSIEHASYLLRLGNDEKSIRDSVANGLKTKAAAELDYLLRFNQEKARNAYRELASKNVFVCPTLIGGKQLAYLSETDHSRDASLAYLTRRFTSKYDWRIQRMAGETAAQQQQRKDRYQLIRAQMPYIHAAGIRIIAGSDAAALNTYVYPAVSLIEELEIFQEAGLSPAQILPTATLNGALYFGIGEKTGTIDPGKEASLVLLDDNPLKDIRALRKVRGVMQEGIYYNRQALDVLLSNAARSKLALDRSRE